MHLVNILFNKVLGKNKEYVFYLYLKLSKLFCQSNILEEQPQFPISGEHSFRQSLYFYYFLIYEIKLEAIKGRGVGYL